MSGISWESSLSTGLQSGAALAIGLLLQSALLIGAGLCIAALLARRGSALQSTIYRTVLLAVLICPSLTMVFTRLGFSGLSPSLSLFLKESPTENKAVIHDPTDPISLVLPESQPLRLQKPGNPALDSIADREVSSINQSSGNESLAGSSHMIESSTKSASTFSNAPLRAKSSRTLPVYSKVIVILGGVWMAGVLWLITRLTVAWWKLARIRNSALPVDAATQTLCQEISTLLGVKAPQVVQTPFLPSPCLAGLIAPTIYLPESDISIPLRDVLTHELAHLRRRDGHWNLLRTIATSVFWCQPMMWHLSRRIEMTAEEVCDDIVLELGGDRAEYAHRLVDVAEFTTVPMAPAAVAFVSFKSMLARRVSRIMDTSRHLSTHTSLRLASTVLIGASFGTLLTGFLGASSDPEPASATQSPPQAAAPVQAPKANGTSTSGDTPAAQASESTAPPVTPPAASQPLVGLLANPPVLSGDRRWQLFTKNMGLSADSVCWSPDGSWLAIANGPTVRLYHFDSDSPEFERVLIGHTDTVKSVQFSAQGDRIATASRDGTVRLWDSEGRLQRIYDGHEDPVNDVSWHPNGQLLATACLDGSVRIWTVEGRTLAVMHDHEAPVNAVSWNPNGQILASGCENKVIRYWSPDGEPGPVIEAHIGPVRSLKWNSEGTQLLSCDFGIEATNGQESDRAHLKVWDQQGQMVSSVQVNQPLSQVSWSPDGKQAVAGAWRSVMLWTIGDQTVNPRMLSYNSGKARVNGFVPVAWRPNGEEISAGPMIMSRSLEPLATMSLRTISLHSVGLNPEGTVLGAGRSDAVFEIFTSDGELKVQSAELFQSSFRMMHSIAWRPDGKTFIPGIRYSSDLQQYDADGQKVGDPMSLPGDSRSVDWSSDGRYVAATGDHQIVALVDLESNEANRIQTIGRHTHGITQVRFRPHHEEVISAGFDGCIRFWSYDGKPLKVLEAISAPICSLAVSGDGQLLASGHQDNLIRLWNGDGEQLNIVGGHGNHVESLVFNPEGTVLASGSRDQSIRLWKRDGTPIGAMHGHSGIVYGISWTPDGRGLYSCADDGTLSRWDIETRTTEWQVLLGDQEGYVTFNSQGHVTHGDEAVLDTDFVVFVEDEQKRLVPSSWSKLRDELNSTSSAPAP